MIVQYRIKCPCCFQESIYDFDADSRLLDNVRLYESHTKFPDGREEVKYAYGAPWVAQALLMDDIRFDTPEEAKAWWERRYGT